MNRKLIIAEKPSLASSIVSAIGSTKFHRSDGYFESPEYIVTFAYGHLFSLLDLEEYQPADDRTEPSGWSLDGLPFRPKTFRFGLRKDPKTHKVDSGVRKQFHIIQELCARKDVTCIVHAGDADREGEIIIRIILEQAKNTKPVMRLWLPDQTAETIRAELQTLRSDKDFDAFANEGYARTYIDWLYGINLTRLATLKSGSLLRVGRVIVPIVKAIYDRDLEIRNFTPEKYFGISSKALTNGEMIELTSKQTFNISQHHAAEALAAAYNHAGAVVQASDTDTKVLKPGKLYSLSKLQGVLGRKFKMSPKESLSIVQQLYEAGYVSYPRTNTEYLATAECDKINRIISKLNAQGYKVCAKDGSSNIYDDSKIESHSALTPTGKFPNQADLKPNVWNVYSTILNRFLAVFCAEECTYDRTTIQISVGDLESFSLTGDVILTKGWLQYDDAGKSDKHLPALKVGDTIAIDFQPIEKTTHPPKHYTVDSMLNYLKNPFRKEKQLHSDANESAGETDTSETEDYRAMFDGVEIGTEATRTGIIDTAIRSQYIALKKDIYTILPAGEFLIESLQKLQIDMDKEKTAELGRVLKKVYRGELTVEESVTIAFREISSSFTASAGITILPQSAASFESFGLCPKCGCEVIEKEKLFGCRNKDCSFALWKDHKLLSSIGVKMNGSIAKHLLHDKQVLLKNCKSSKTGNTFSGILHVDFSGDTPVFRLELAEAEDLSLGKCPKCGAPVIERDKAFCCSSKACRFAIWKDDKYFSSLGRKPTAAIVKSLLSKGSVSLKNCTSQKSGKSFDCRITVDFSGQWPKYSLQFLKGKK